MLHYDEIKKEGLIRLPDGSPAPDKFYDYTSYNLRLGGEYCLIQGGRHGIRSDDCSSGIGMLSLPPFACVLVSTEEIVKLPLDIAGRWGLKIRPAMSGLVFQAGPQIEPGSYTRLFGLLFNLSSEEKHIKHLSTMWSIDFERLRKPVRKKPLQQHPIIAMREYTQHGLPFGSLNEIYAGYQRLQKENSARREVAIGIFLVIVVLLSSTLLPVVVSEVVYNRSDVANLFIQNQQLETKIGQLTNRVNQLERSSTKPTTTNRSP
jgi:deoxycytidine triphosphate deaminase